MEDLLKLLQHHKILVKLLTQRGNRKVTSYFMPCILKNATPSELQVCSCPEAAALMIIYDCGYVPLGMFCSMVISLSSQDYVDWEIYKEKLYRNKVQFFVGDRSNEITLIGYPTYLKVVISGRGADKTPITTVCREVRQTIAETLGKVTAELNYHIDSNFLFGFQCFCNKEHLCVKKKQFLCCWENQSNRVELNDSQAVWFEVSKCSIFPHYNNFVTYFIE